MIDISLLQHVPGFCDFIQIPQQMLPDISIGYALNKRWMVLFQMHRMTSSSNQLYKRENLFGKRKHFATVTEFGPISTRALATKRTGQLGTYQ